MFVEIQALQSLCYMLYIFEKKNKASCILYLYIDDDPTQGYHPYWLYLHPLSKGNNTIAMLRMHPR